MADFDSTKFIERLLFYTLFCLIVIITDLLWSSLWHLITFLENILSSGNFSNTIIIEKIRQAHSVTLKGNLSAFLAFGERLGTESFRY